MKTLVKILSLFLLTATNAMAQCPIDTSGLGEKNTYDGNLPNDHINADGARTLDDFVNAAANELFFTAVGADFIASSAGNIIFFRGYGGASNNASIPQLIFLATRAMKSASVSIR